MFISAESEPTIYFCSIPVDLRNGCEGLASIASTIVSNPLENTYFVFLNRRRTRIKILHWTDDSLFYWFARSRTRVFAPQKSRTSLITLEELKMILCGKFPNRLNQT